jgi:transcriptional regulator with GAF, ATPase, and Fis domain
VPAYAEGPQLAEAFAQIARDLQIGTTPEQTGARIVAAAVHTVPGCDHAGISLVHRRGRIQTIRIETVAASDDLAAAVDAIQYETDQGPCLEAMRDHESYLICDLMVEDRWPSFIRRAAEETSIRSLLSFRLFLSDDTLGALNLYSRAVNAFDPDAHAVGAILAAHAAVAMNTARERERAEHLEQAVASNREIGMAMGVVMANGLQTREQAFDVLRRASQRLNVKLRDIASAVVETGELPELGNSQARSRRSAH